MFKARRFAYLTLVCAACTGQTLEIGTNDAGPTSSSASKMPVEAGTKTTPEPIDSGPPPGSMLGGDAGSALLGTWTGYVESFAFSSGSDNVALTFSQDASGNVEGTVNFGQGQPPPPAIDPNTGYPPSLEGTSPSLLGIEPLSGRLPAEGYPFTALAMSFDGIRLRVGVIEREPWKGWCALQTPYGVMPDGGGPPYACAPNWGVTETASGCTQTDPATQQMVTIDCVKFSLCQPLVGPCDCTASACAVDMTAAPDVTFDMQLMGDRLDGSTVLSGQVHNVHLTHSP